MYFSQDLKFKIKSPLFYFGESEFSFGIFLLGELFFEKTINCQLNKFAINPTMCTCSCVTIIFLFFGPSLNSNIALIVYSLLIKLMLRLIN